MGLVQDIEESLQQAIAGGEFVVGSLLPTERELQVRFSASRSTIRRALANLVASGWGVNRANRGVECSLGVRDRVSQLIAFVDFADLVHKSLFFSLSQKMATFGFHLVHVDSTVRGTLGALEHAAETGFAAAVFWGKDVFLDSARFERIQAKIPVIAVDHVPNGIRSDVVLGDHFGGARLAVGHLLDMGRKQVAISGYWTFVEDTALRLLGYEAALGDHGMQSYAYNMVFSAPSPEESHDNPRLLEHRLSEDDRPDAVFVLHDISAAAIVSSVMNAGLRIPEDVAVVGFGNDVPITLGDVGLTTVGLDWIRIAEALAERIVFRLNRHSAPEERIVVPAHLIIRGSCGAPRSAWSNEPYQVSSATITGRLPSHRPAHGLLAV